MMVPPGCQVPLQQAPIKRLTSVFSVAPNMRHLFICALLCLLPTAVFAQTPAKPRQAQGPDLSTSPARVLDWANRLMAKDPKVRATAEAALVKGAGRSVPVLRRLLSRGDEDLELRTFELVRRIGPPAI